MTGPDDPYRWLEESSPETIAWQDRQDAIASERLAAWPGRERLGSAVAVRRHESLLFVPQRCGERWFQLVAREPGTEPVLCVGERLGDQARTLVDPGAWPGTAVSLDWFSPSPDGAYVAFGVCERGSEQSVLHVLETDTGRLLPERIANTSFGVVSWLPDSSGFFYNAGLGPDTELPQKHLFLHRLGDELPGEPEPASVREDEDYVFPQVSADGRWVAAVSSEVEPRADSIRALTADGEWLPFLVGCPGTFSGCFHDDRYLAVTTDGAPRGRLVSIPLSSPSERSTWVELVPEGDGVLRSFAVVDDRVAVVDLVETCSRIRVFSLDGPFEDEVTLPGTGTVGLSCTSSQAMIQPMLAADGGALLFAFSTFARAPALYRYDVAARQLEQLGEPAAEIPGLSSELRRCRSSDGAEVTFWVVRRAVSPTPGPALLHGYGGWNIAHGLPSYLAELAPFVEAGGTLVRPHLRGGGEHGERQWHEGRLEHKQRTFDDLYAVAEALVADGVAERGRLAVAGASNGGLLAGAALTQRPELFRAVVPIVPLLDMLRHVRDPYLAEYAVEYGDPRDAAFEPILRAYSPYHNVGDGQAYPAALVVCGDSDVRCPSWHARKLVARLLEANRSEHPILLRVVREAGHLTAISRSTHEWLGFVMAELGMTP
jgi:prolyl oligopeptidase